MPGTVGCCCMNRQGAGIESGAGRELQQSTRGETVAATTRMEVIERKTMAVLEIYFEIQSEGRWQN